jgi:hypothetical protein
MCHYRESGSYQPECSFTLHCVHKQAAAYRPTCGDPEASQPQGAFRVIYALNSEFENARGEFQSLAEAKKRAFALADYDQEMARANCDERGYGYTVVSPSGEAHGPY